ncbi:NAD-dependent epimerase/dehydratase family protein [Halolamina sp.]|jgi:nucleoside-diphosphate-sugar epimerase|uniref:NAD-dependent epimerase/dehydratase family protein n=1 Tax=Halolamina sp. TaxID=1940283 RepID=UPI003566E14D
MRVVILGCGYVGQELASKLEDAGHDAVGVVRSEASAAERRADGIEAVVADLTDSEAVDRLPDADALVFAASAGRGSVKQARALYIDGLRSVISAYQDRDHPPERVLFTSSTGVYGDHEGGWVDESTPVSPKSPKAGVIAKAEALVHTAPFESTVARFAGLYGPGRYRLSSYLDSVTEGWRNSTHRDDAAGALAWFLREDCGRNETILVTDGEPVQRWAFGDWLAAECGEPEPAKQTVGECIAADHLSPESVRRLRSEKRCRNDRLLELGYELEYENIYEGYADAIAAYRAADGSV